MKHFSASVMGLLMVLTGIFGQNPFIKHMYTADPSARVFHDTLFVYPSHDPDTATWFNMTDWHVFSTTDMKRWTDHGVAFSVKDVSWATKYAWAPDCAYANGRYYFYYPLEQDYIGVAVGDKPYGKFTDPLGKPLITRQTPGVVNNRDLIDPCIFIDEDHTPYLIFGQNDVNIVKLNEDMISFSDTVRVIQGADHFFEAVWMHKYNDKYYLSYSGNGKILYGIGNNPYGPFEYKGIILEEMNSGTNHHSIVEYKGQWYLFYHNSDLYFEHNPDVKPVLNWDSPNPFRRSVCVDKLYYNDDGTIKQVIPTKEGIIERPAIWGIARMTFLVSDFQLARDYYGRFLGFDEAFEYPSDLGTVISFKVNDRQFLEFVKDPDAQHKNRLVSISFETENVEKMRQFLKYKGLNMPDKTRNDGAGNEVLSFQDPSGNQVEFIEYKADALHLQSKGRFLSDNRIAKRIHHVGLFTDSINDKDPFYTGILNFREILRVPEDKKLGANILYLGTGDGTENIEFYSPSDRNFSHPCFLVDDMQETIYTLKERKTDEKLNMPVIGKGGRWILNLANKDGTRVEFTEGHRVR